MPYGLEPDVLDREFNYLLAAHCVIAEHLRLDSVEDDDLIRLGPAGFAHLDLVGNLSYIAAVAEDTNFSDRLQAERVAQRIRNIESHSHLKTALNNGSDLVEFLSSVQKSLMPPNGSYLQDDLLDRLTDITDAREVLIRVSKAQSHDPWFDADKRMERQSRHNATITNVVDYGCFAELEDGLIGLLHKNYMAGISLCCGDRVEVEVLWVDVVQRKIALKFVAILEEEAGDMVPGA